MNTWGKSLATVLSATLLASVAACSSEPRATYDSVDELKQAFVEAGGQCDAWDESNSVKIAQQSGECGTDTVLSVYLSKDATERRIEATKDSIFGTLGDDWLVGKNWIVNAPDAAQYQESLGGRVVSFASE